MWCSGDALILASLTLATAEIHIHRAPGDATDLTGLQTSATCPSPTARELTPLMGTSRPANQLVARLMVVGDSTACTMVPGLEAVAAPLGIQVENAAVIGCGVVSGQVGAGHRQWEELTAPTRLCAAKAAAAEARALRVGQPNVVLWASSWERDPIVVGSGTHQRVLVQGSAPWETVLLQRMTQRIRQFEATGATVVLLTQPPFAPELPLRPQRTGTLSASTVGDAGRGPTSSCEVGRSGCPGLSFGTTLSAGGRQGVGPRGRKALHRRWFALGGAMVGSTARDQGAGWTIQSAARDEAGERRQTAASYGAPRSLTPSVRSACSTSPGSTFGSTAHTSTTSSSDSAPLEYKYGWAFTLADYRCSRRHLHIAKHRLWALGEPQRQCTGESQGGEFAALRQSGLLIRRRIPSRRRSLRRVPWHAAIPRTRDRRRVRDRHEPGRPALRHPRRPGCATGSGGRRRG